MMTDPAYRQRLKEMFQPCLQRSDCSGKLELVSLEWLAEMAHSDPDPLIHLTSPEVNVPYADLVKDLKKRGLRDPFIITVGLSTGRARLEDGAHRLKALLELGFLHAPAICWVGASHVGQPQFSHEGRSVCFWPGTRPLLSLGPFDERYFELPSLILPSVPFLRWDEPKPSLKSTSKSTMPIDVKLKTPKVETKPDTKLKTAAPSSPSTPSSTVSPTLSKESPDATAKPATASTPSTPFISAFQPLSTPTASGSLPSTTSEPSSDPDDELLQWIVSSNDLSQGT